MLIYSMSVSVDGFIADREGAFGWTAPHEEQFRFHIARTRELGGYLCGRRLYETMLVWETDPSMRDNEHGVVERVGLGEVRAARALTRSARRPIRSGLAAHYDVAGGPLSHSLRGTRLSRTRLACAPDGPSAPRRASIAPAPAGEASVGHGSDETIAPRIEKLSVVCSAQVPRRDARIDPTLAWRAAGRDWTVGGFPVAGTGVDSSRDGDEL